LGCGGSLAASLDTTSTMKKTLGVDFQPLRSIFPVSACFRGQIGEMSAIPHAMGTGRRIRRGDVLIAEAAVEIGGYSCELERTMIVANPLLNRNATSKLWLKPRGSHPKNKGRSGMQRS